MNKLTKLSLGIITAFILSACSSQADNVSARKVDTHSSDVSNQAEDDATRYENGLGETQTERYKMIVLPTQIDLTSQNNFPISPSALSNTLSHEIATALYETHRFDILSTDLAATENDKNIENNSIKTDFYLKSTLNQLDTQETVRILKATGQGVEEKVVSATVLYQIIDAKSNKIAFSRSLRYQLKSTAYNETFPTTINNTIKSIAGLMKSEIINEIYPIRILRADKNEIILDHPLPLGSQCEVIRIGKKVKDVYTDSLLGYEQNVVGKLLIIQTTSVLAYGQIMEGQVEKGDSCKPLQATILAAPELVKRTQQGGVVLPFD